MTSIRTPDQRVRVVVSSTINELSDARTAARRAIEQLRLTPVMFELGARPYPPRDLYLAYLQQSDVFVGIYGEQYGLVAPGRTVSGLEDEYLAASNKPKLVYVQQSAPAREARLTEMLDRLSHSGLSYHTFEHAEELVGLISADLAVLLSERFNATSATGQSPGVASEAAGTDGTAATADASPHDARVRVRDDLGRLGPVTGLSDGIGN